MQRCKNFKKSLRGGTWLAALAALALFAAAGCGAATPAPATPAPSAARATDGFTPISDVPVTVTVAVEKNQYNPDDASRLWFVQYMKEFHNLEMKVDWVVDVAERKSLMFAANDLPDMIHFMLSKSELVQFGMTNGQLLPISDYLSEALTPNILRTMEEVPAYRPAVTLPNGKIYTTAYVLTAYENLMNYNGTYINTRLDWLNEIGKPEPKTMDELLEVLRALKAAAGTGSIPADVIPFGGGTNGNGLENPHSTFYNAFGLATRSDNAAGLAITSEGITVVGYDKERYTAFLKFMRTLYQEELISRDYFTLDENQLSALAVNGKVGFMSMLPVLLFSTSKAESGMPAGFEDYWITNPWSSPLNPTGAMAGVPQISEWTIGADSISAATKHPEVLVKYLDWWYTDEGAVIGVQNFPAFDTKKQYGLGMFEVKLGKSATGADEVQAVAPDGTILNQEPEAANKYFTCFYPSNFNYDQYRKVFGLWGITPPSGGPSPMWGDTGKEENKDKTTYDRQINTGYKNFMPHATGPALPVLYVSPAVEAKNADLLTVVKPYIDTETAKFITGQRPLTQEELDKYFAELKALGVEEYLMSQIDAYNRATQNQ
jgi:putative aldouronate transport system substrate-binding protein